MKIVWTEPARQDLRNIFTYIAEDNPKTARTLLNEHCQTGCLKICRA